MLGLMDDFLNSVDEFSRQEVEMEEEKEKMLK